MFQFEFIKSFACELQPWSQTKMNIYCTSYGNVRPNNRNSPSLQETESLWQPGNEVWIDPLLSSISVLCKNQSSITAVLNFSALWKSKLYLEIENQNSLSHSGLCKAFQHQISFTTYLAASLASIDSESCQRSFPSFCVPLSSSSCADWLGSEQIHFSIFDFKSFLAICYSK